jgi:hypothetical protein
VELDGAHVFEGTTHRGELCREAAPVARHAGVDDRHRASPRDDVYLGQTISETGV